ncbi:MAG: hypothetical protein JWO38_6789 [Gemmataceae bacterium]|nr:hypothetical protein [Gemmataceae bacterium]
MVRAVWRRPRSWSKSVGSSGPVAMSRPASRASSTQAARLPRSGAVGGWSAPFVVGPASGLAARRVVVAMPSPRVRAAVRAFAAGLGRGDRLM